ncbi:exoenzymes regulatory protein AepA precursor [Photobacterium aphoticum]|uniref:Exoenzymes regulatory protein AepA n=1 Tax=Photobacterium aphoticum TaxID=754436 RepID=A0A090R9C9_9GAMM|nr:exoenzymes regulatory protein AepA precursor [Photobacterium aphoticum]
MLVAGLCVEPVFARSSVDTLISGGIVYNMPPDTVIGISDGKISYLGEGKGAKALLTDTTTHIDAKGASIYPGFIDLHTHLFDTIGFDNVSCELNIQTSERTEDACQLRAEELQPGEWLVGFAEGLLTADLGISHLAHG